MKRIMPIETCAYCFKELTGGRDTFGSIGSPVCIDCHLEEDSLIDKQMSHPWYGLAPHTHDMSKTGTFIGSTVLSALPEPNEQGDIDLGNVWYRPDPDCEGCGVYTPKTSQEMQKGTTDTLVV